MLVLCGGALIAGAAASLTISFVPFALALTLAIGIGAGWAGFHGTPPLHVVLSAAALLVATQVGYGLGVTAMAATESVRRSTRRPSAAKSIASPLTDLHIGEKP